MQKKLDSYLETYLNNEDSNNQIYDEFTKRTNSIDFLKNHRDFIEKNNLGFGDRAFAFMWLLLLDYLKDKRLNGGLLEIGVFKGQVISLWSLISKEMGFQFQIAGITPLEGNPGPKSTLLKSLLYRISKKYRGNVDSGNHYQNLDYLQIIKALYENFHLSLDNVNIIKGYSTDRSIIKEVSKHQFSLIYIDGDHTFEGVTQDIINYSRLLQEGGLLIMDDASCNIPGTRFWKGHQSVSNACLIIEGLGFTNILNVGHNRIYKKSNATL